MIQGIESRETYIYRGLNVDALRAVDFALARPEIDSGRIGIMGSSQGGGLALMSAGLHPEVACVSVGGPFLTGMMATTSLIHSSPYEEINEYLRCFPSRLSLVAETLSYFDCLFIASEIHCPLIMNLGLQDDVCPPPTGLAAFDLVPAREKKLYTYKGHGHDAGEYHHDSVIAEFLQRQLRP